MIDFNITRVAHAELRVTDFEKARRFYVEALGLIEVDATDDRIYLGGYEERDKYSLVLRKADSPGLGHIAFRVAEETDLEKIAAIYEDNGCPIRWIEENSEEKGQGRALRVQDPSGIPIEFFHKIEQRESLLQRFDQYRGINVMRIDHVNVMVPDVATTEKWWKEKLGFWCSEYTVTDDEKGLWPPGYTVNKMYMTLPLQMALVQDFTTMLFGYRILIAYLRPVTY